VLRSVRQACQDYKGWVREAPEIWFSLLLLTRHITSTIIIVLVIDEEPLVQMPWEARIGSDVMGCADPKQAIAAYLVQPRGKLMWDSQPSPAGWRGAVSRGAGRDADPVTLRCVKQRSIPGYELHAVAFADSDGRHYRYL
jgi:hypothetical protein